MLTQSLGLPLTDLIRLRQELRRLSAAAAAARRPQLARCCDATAAGISQWMDDVMPPPRAEVRR